MSTAICHNNFNPLRLVAAWLILFSHCFVLYDRSPDPFTAWLKLPPATFYALAAFFTISGYLVTASWQRQPHIGRYAANRMLRILPGLATVILLSVFVLGPLVSSLGASGYFAHGDTWKYLRGMFVFGMRYSLPGVFDSVPYADVVNGSLWSLKLEVQCYFLLAALGVAGLLRPRLALLLATACLVANGLLTHMQPPPKYLLGMKYGNLTNFTLWGFFFWAGSSLRLYASMAMASMPLYRPLPLAGLLLIAVAGYYAIPDYGYFLHAACLPALVIALALHVPALRLGWLERNDLSYGVYLYAFPIQQCCMLLVGHGIGLAGFILLSTLVTLCAAWLSWRLVEHPALAWKTRLRLTVA